MTLKRAGAPLGPGESADDTPEVPESVPRHAGNSRPKIRHADDPTVMSYWDRASSFGKGLESSFLIDRAGNRQVVYGMSRRADLVELAQAVDGLTEPADKEELTRIGALAKEVAGGNAAANRGTALHKLSERADAGLDLTHVSPALREALEVWRSIMGRFVIHATEVFVACDRWEVAGTFDRIGSPLGVMVAPDGARITPDDRLVIDLKSGQWDPSYWGATYRVQQAVYAHGLPYVHVDDQAARSGDNGRWTWPDGVAPRTDWALIPHVPIGAPQDAGLYWVDLVQGAADADVAAGMRAAGRRSNCYLPAELPEVRPSLCTLGCGDGRSHVEDNCHGPADPDLGMPEPEAVDPLLLAIEAAPDEATLTALWQAHQDVWSVEHSLTARVRLAELVTS